eukprot:TRINITY_DN11131_c0_g2_i1.p1 TRINITY_DN11131_c0_g2~~TRINITY_DN11131_c0_g2_i1.p1  ORF type:complete len:282 (+),score=26.75 TRINITY_DN11131_c0_g2_i1:52-846(+)
MSWKRGLSFEHTDVDCQSPSSASRPRDDKGKMWALMLLVVMVIFTITQVGSHRGVTSIHGSYIAAYDTVSRQKLRPVSIDEAHLKGVAHWATWVLLIDFDKEVILLQKRSNTPNCPGAWGITGEHLEPNETIADAAIRGLKEELQFEAEREKLTLLDNFIWRHSYRNNRVDIQNSTVYLYPINLGNGQQFTTDAESEKAEIIPLETFRHWCVSDIDRLCGHAFAKAYLKFLQKVCAKTNFVTEYCVKYHRVRQKPVGKLFANPI